MKKFQVYIERHRAFTVEVEANSPEQAQDIALEHLSEGHYEAEEDKDADTWDDIKAAEGKLK